MASEAPGVVETPRERRWVEQKDAVDPFEYDESKLPVEWQAWLRHTRGDPPTVEECRLAEARRIDVQRKAERLKQLGKDGPPPAQLTDMTSGEK